MHSGWLRVVRGSSEAKAPLLAARPGEGVLLGQQLRALCLETELGKRSVCPCLSSLLRGRVGTRLIGLQGAGHVVQVYLEGCYVGDSENVVESSVEPYVVEFCGERCGPSGFASMMDVCWYSLREFHVGWWLSSSNLERVSMRSLVICLVPRH